MLRILFRAVLFAVLLLFAAGAASAQESGSGAGAAEPKDVPKELQERIVHTKHVLKEGWSELEYTAETGVVHVDSGEPGTDDATGAAFFIVSYIAENEGDADRPVTFAFNGGPGASSVWLHLGAMGPYAVDLNPDGTVPPPPVGLAPNPDTWLAFTDLVFIDPVGTGFSRSLSTDPEKRKKAEEALWDVEGDVESVADCIRVWLSRHDRWGSPIFLAGESYGTTRAAALAGHLQNQLGLNCNGVLLISPVLDFHTLDSEALLPNVLMLPTMAAAAHHHGKAAPAGQPLQDVLQAAETFASTDYLHGLYLGSRADAADAAALVDGVASFTGLDPALVQRLRGRVPPHIFFRELLADRGLIVGRMDATLTGANPSPESSWPAYDPSLQGYYGPFATAMNDYLRTTLEYATDMEYEFLNSEVSRKWQWRSGFRGQGYVNTAEDLTRTMAVNPHMRVFVGCGYYDMATPYYAAEYTVAQMALDPELLANVEFAYYEAGHMMYTHTAARKKLHQDVREFYKRSL